MRDNRKIRGILFKCLASIRANSICLWGSSFPKREKCSEDESVPMQRAQKVYSISFPKETKLFPAAHLQLWHNQNFNFVQKNKT